MAYACEEGRCIRKASVASFELRWRPSLVPLESSRHRISFKVVHDVDRALMWLWWPILLLLVSTPDLSFSLRLHCFLIFNCSTFSFSFWKWKIQHFVLVKLSDNLMICCFFFTLWKSHIKPIKINYQGQSRIKLMQND